MQKTTHLQHHPRLGYSHSKHLRDLPATVAEMYPCDRLISFRLLPGHKPNTIVRKLHAADRPLGIYDGGSLCFYGVQSDSPLAPLLLWDAAHFLAVGQQITIVEDSPVGFYLDREYFQAGLKVVRQNGTVAVFEKVAKLPAETDDDLDSWTFGIPVGPEDATVLNAVVKRILEIDIPNKEIVLCGKPGANFAYSDHVRIVGEDITAPPVQICKKKNRLAKEAKYNNLVILHDRVFLPKHFGEMVRRFGPRYPLMTLQSMFFDNRLSMSPRRYSDYGMAMGEIGQGLKGLHRSSGEAVSIAPSIFTEIERTGFCFASPMRYNKDTSYPTGSMYICRKEVWNAFPLDESLLWVEFEDIEQGIRASKGGVPCRVNPHGISQTVTTRALLGVPSPVETADGQLTKTGPAYLSPLPKKPLFKVSTDTALAKLRQFAAKYHLNPNATQIPTGLKKISARNWVSLVNSVVQQASFPNTQDAVHRFIEDYERMVLLDQLPNTQKEALYLRFLEDPAEAKRMLVINSSELRNMLYQRPRQSWFYTELREFFHGRKASLPGILLSAISVYLKNGSVFYFTSLPAAVRSIYNSTPFKSYTEALK
ncbi:TPA: hypothetical protein ACSPMB_002814 [Pseudomonas aeruginosa]